MEWKSGGTAAGQYRHHHSREIDVADESGLLFLGEVADGTAFGQTVFGRDAFEAVTLAGVLAFTAIFCRLAIGIAFAVMHGVAMHFVVGGNGHATAAFG